jgi:hypothetical protein
MLHAELAIVHIQAQFAPRVLVCLHDPTLSPWQTPLYKPVQGRKLMHCNGPASALFPRPSLSAGICALHMIHGRHRCLGRPAGIAHTCCVRVKSATPLKSMQGFELDHVTWQCTVLGLGLHPTQCVRERIARYISVHPIAPADQHAGSGRSG